VTNLCTPDWPIKCAFAMDLPPSLEYPMERAVKQSGAQMAALKGDAPKGWLTLLFG
jgi:hypothetical protein